MFTRIPAQEHLSDDRLKRLRQGSSNLDKRCLNDEVGACEAALIELGDNLGGTRSELEPSIDTVARHACAMNVLSGCAALVGELTACGHQPSATECAQNLEEEWQQQGASMRIDALRRQRSACTAGDADACQSLPGRSISPSILCSAHDYSACATLGCFGDEPARELGLEHHAAVDCDREKARASATDNAQNPDSFLPPLVADPPLKDFEPMLTNPFVAVAFRQLDARGFMGWPIFEAYNLGTKPIQELSIVGYAYNKDGEQILRTQSSIPLRGLDIGPGKSALIKQVGRAAGDEVGSEAVHYQLCYDMIALDDETTPLVDPQRCPSRLPLSNGGRR